MGVINFLATAIPLVTIEKWGWLGWILRWIQGGVVNAAWTMVIFTLIIKLVTFPLDFYSRYKMKKNAVIMEDLKPVLEKLQKQCKGDKTMYNQRMYPMLKKEGYSTFGACLPTLVTLALFIFIFSGLNTYATARNADIYNRMVETYNYHTLTADEYNALEDPSGRYYIDTKDAGADVYDVSTEAGKTAVDELLVKRYDELNPSWLWVKNPWRPDVAYSEKLGIFSFVAPAQSVATYREFTDGKFGIRGIKGENVDEAVGINNYNKVMGAVSADKGTNNGLYILIVLAVGISFFSQWLMQKTQQASNQDMAGCMGKGTMKFMLILFPIMMGFFAFSYTSVFTLYIITNSLFTTGSTFLINYIVGVQMKKLQEKKLAAVKYRRY